MVWFAFFLIFAALVTFIVSFFVAKEASDTFKTPYRRNTRIGAVAVLALGALLTFVASIATVSTKNVGIETAFGRVDGHLTNGFHLIAPWDSVTEMDAAIQTDSYAQGNCINVRIANQQTACVDVSIRWRINPSAADYLFQNYRDFTNVQDSLVTRELNAALNAQLANYNPLDSVSISGPGTAPTLTTIANRVTTQMRQEIGKDIDVLNTIIPIITFDSQTQARLNQLNAQVAATRTAQQQLQTNQAQSAANQALSASVNTSPNVLVYQCLNILSQMVQNHVAVPAGFTCWPGNGVAGVIANSTGG